MYNEKTLSTERPPTRRESQDIDITQLSLLRSFEIREGKEENSLSSVSSGMEC